MGRTGTFCALMMCHDRLKTEHMADVFYAIKTIRAQRPGMVGNAVSTDHCVQLRHYLIVLCFRNNTSLFIGRLSRQWIVLLHTLIFETSTIQKTHSEQYHQTVLTWTICFCIFCTYYLASWLL